MELDFPLRYAMLFPLLSISLKLFQRVSVSAASYLSTASFHVRSVTVVIAVCGFIFMPGVRPRLYLRTVMILILF